MCTIQRAFMRKLRPPCLLKWGAHEGVYSAKGRASAFYWRKMNGQHDEMQQGRESPRGKSSSEKVSERTSENLREVPFCNLVFIPSVPLGGFRRSSRRPSRRKISLPETLRLVAPHRGSPSCFSNSKHLLSVKRSLLRTILKTLSLLKPRQASSKNPSKKHMLLKRLLRTLLRGVLLHDPLPVHPDFGLTGWPDPDSDPTH